MSPLLPATTRATGAITEEDDVGAVTGRGPRGNVDAAGAFARKTSCGGHRALVSPPKIGIFGKTVRGLRTSLHRTPAQTRAL